MSTELEEVRRKLEALEQRIKTLENLVAIHHHPTPPQDTKRKAILIGDAFKSRRY